MNIQYILIPIGLTNMTMLVLSLHYLRNTNLRVRTSGLREDIERLELLGHSMLAGIARQEASAIAIAENLARSNERVATVARDLLEAKSKVEGVAGALADAKVKVEGVATDLLESQQRADQVQQGAPGEAADAGAQNSKDPSVSKDLR